LKDLKQRFEASRNDGTRLNAAKLMNDYNPEQTEKINLRAFKLALHSLAVIS